jgi:Bacteroidetes VLRF1 release factor
VGKYTEVQSQGASLKLLFTLTKTFNARNDNSKGKAKSAGAGIRRYNEQALTQEVQALLRDWKALINTSSLVFLRATGQNRNTVYFDGAILNAQDDRIRKFPFSTKRPTFAELQRCFAELTTVKISIAKPEDIATEKVDAKPVEEPERPKTHLQYNLAEIVSQLSEEQVKIIDCIKKGKIASLKQMITVENMGTVLADKDGISYLHIASAAGESDIVEYLIKLGADITVKGAKGNSRPYDVCENKGTRDVYRRYMANNPERWDYKLANVPGPLTAEMEEKQKEKDRERSRKEKERKKLSAKEPSSPVPEVAVSAVSSSNIKRLAAVGLSRTEKASIGMTHEQRLKLDREKRFTILI